MMLMRQFRVTAASLGEAVEKIFAKAPDMIGPPRIFQAVDGSYECQVEVRESEDERMDKAAQVSD